MKFAKQLETESESIPSEWRPYLIQYKKLKKLIAKVADEIEKHGMSVSMLHDCLDNSSSVDQVGVDSPQVQYYFTGKTHLNPGFFMLTESPALSLLGEAPNIRPCIRFTYDTSNNKVMALLSDLIDEQGDAPLLTRTAPRSPLEYQRSQDNTDFFTLINNPAPITETPATTTNDQDEHYFAAQPSPRRNSTAQVIRDLTELTLHKDEDGKRGQVRSLVVELEQDDEFFYMLMTELQSAVRLQHKASDRFEADINALEKQMVQVVSGQVKRKTNLTHISISRLLLIRNPICTLGAKSLVSIWMPRSSRASWRPIDQCTRYKRQGNR
jgi:E3 ubiquitin-protein ligase BAH